MRKASLLLVGALFGAVATVIASAPGGLGGFVANAANGSAYQQLDLFGDVFERVRSSYVEQPVDENLIEGALNGMLATLDPHSEYLSEERYREMIEQTSGEFGGLGIHVTMEDGVVKVISPIEDTPADRAGIVAGDLITHLDGDPIQGMTLTEAVKIMKGAPGTDISLTIIREGEAEPIEVTVTRDIIQTTTIRHEIDGDIGYVRITNFASKTDQELREAIEEIEDEIGSDAVVGYVLDLRNNPGGLLQQAIAVSDAFLDRGEIVSTRGRDPEQIERRNARPGDFIRGKPVIVLINGGSASASEIVAGALQDQRRATVIGTRSFGKASVQTMIPLGGSNGALKLTTARYYTPSGRSIQAQGIAPDIIVEQVVPEDIQGQDTTSGEAGLDGHLAGEGEEENSGSSTYVPPDREDDVQLQYALNLLRGVATHDSFPPNEEDGVAN